MEADRKIEPWAFQSSFSVMSSYWEGYTVLSHWQIRILIFFNHWSVQVDNIFIGNICLYGNLRSTSSNIFLPMLMYRIISTATMSQGTRKLCCCPISLISLDKLFRGFV